MKKEQKNQVKERLESILKEELKPIESIIKLIEEAKEEKKFIYKMCEEMDEKKIILHHQDIIKNIMI